MDADGFGNLLSSVLEANKNLTVYEIICESLSDFEGGEENEDSLSPDEIHSAAASVLSALKPYVNVTLLTDDKGNFSEFLVEIDIPEDKNRTILPSSAFSLTFTAKQGMKIQKSEYEAIKEEAETYADSEIVKKAISSDVTYLKNLLGTYYDEITVTYDETTGKYNLKLTDVEYSYEYREAYDSEYYYDFELISGCEATFALTDFAEIISKQLCGDDYVILVSPVVTGTKNSYAKVTAYRSDDDSEVPEQNKLGEEAYAFIKTSFPNWYALEEFTPATDVNFVNVSLLNGENTACYYNYKTKTITAQKVSHAFAVDTSEENTEPKNCATPGKTHYKCETCGAKYIEYDFLSGEDSHKNYVVKNTEERPVDPDRCRYVKIAVCYCNDCESEFEKTERFYKHSYEETTTSDGKTCEICPTCGSHREHKTEETSPTCSRYGKAHYACKCGYCSYYEIVEAPKGHSYVFDKEKQLYVCSVCGYESEDTDKTITIENVTEYEKGNYASGYFVSIVAIYENDGYYERVDVETTVYLTYTDTDGKTVKITVDTIKNYIGLYGIEAGIPNYTVYNKIESSIEDVHNPVLTFEIECTGETVQKTVEISMNYDTYDGLFAA